MRGKGAILRSSITEDVTIERVRDAWSQVTDMSKAEQMSSITEATGSLVELLDQLEGGQGGAQKSGNSNQSDISDVFSFGNKDLILYALGGKSTF